jgi:hypothetical protein
MMMKSNARPKNKIHLRFRDLQRMKRVKPGSTLHCAAGVLWVTQSGDRKDYILRPNEAMTVTHRGEVLVQAMRDAEFHVA